MNWPGVLKSKLMLEIGVTVSVAAVLVTLPAQSVTTTRTSVPFMVRERLEIAKLAAVAPVTFTPLVCH